MSPIVFGSGNYMEKNPIEVQHITSVDFRNAPFDKVILPLGSLESHGPHLPFATDTFTAYLLACEIASQVPKTIVLPPLNYGMSEHYKEFPFTVSLQPETEISLIFDILESVFREGIRKVFLLNGHDGNIAPIEIASRKMKVRHPEMKIVSLDAWWNMLGPLLPPGFFEVWNGLGHGGEAETSIALALFPELCEPENACGMVPDLPSHIEVKWKFSELTNCGASGDPTKGTREKGLAMKDLLIKTVIGVLRELDDCDWDYRSSEMKALDLKENRKS